MNIGLIGIGTMGTPIGQHLLNAGYSLCVHDIRPAQHAPLVAAGATAASNAREVAEQSDVVFTSLPGPENIAAVCRGASGLLAGLKPGKAYFDLSTNSPTLAREIHDEFRQKGVDMLDAPVSGGPYGAKSGILSMWVSGSRAAYDQQLEILQTLGDEIDYIGDIGNASIAKLVHNCAGFVAYASLAEVFSVGIKAGLEADLLWETVRKGLNGRRGMFDCLARNFLPNQYDPPDFSLALAEKDCRLAVNLADEHRVPMKLAKYALAEMQEAMARDWSDRDARISMLLQLERAGIEPPSIDPERINEILDETN